MSVKPVYESDDNFEKYRLYIIKVASQLCYPKEILNKLRRAKTEFELNRIMMSARNKMGGD